MFEINNQVHENTINFLYEAATTILPKANPSLMLLKSFYINKTRDIARCENLTIPNKIYGPLAMCQKCSVPWGEGTCKLSVYSTNKKLKRTNFIMAQKQKCSRKNYKKYVVLKCTICKSRTKQILPKPVLPEVKQPPPNLVKNITPQLLTNPNNRPQMIVSSSKKSKSKKSKAVPIKSIHKSKKPNQNHILQLAKLLSLTNNRPATSNDDKLKQFLK